ncbi:DUF1963 domain-containing protein [Bradyrhizobium australafricanum]|uniref:DUF1963 domain-containing protein n=1 Tax=Bradyrhizobium australafricanum TaxID=2821406 RepID=UPI001CE2AE57|nr:DUF1963 domain-containing protein [Bradyrhizobium australafricanum]MCA6101587.1 DUF1963 domain-containing protein [Bradyrhizobium australafricanum]
MKDFIAKFLTYNLEMLAKASDEDPAAHDQNAVWLRAAIPACPAAAEIGWIGGNPELPDPFQWPGRDGQPYQFLCQINCASLPPSLWGGVGPRTGWLAFFAAVSGRIDVKVIHQPTLGPQRCNERAWQKSATGLYWVDDKYDGLLAPPPRWPLDFVHPVDGESCVPNRLRRKPSADAVFAIASWELQPIDWRTLELLVQEALAQSRAWAERLADAARQQEARLKPPRKELVTAFEQLAETAERLREALARSEAEQPFSLQSWLSHAELVLRIRELHGEITLQRGGSFVAALDKSEIELANGEGFLAPVWVKSKAPLFPPDTEQGRRYAGLVQLIQDLERDLQADVRMPSPDRGVSADLAGWLEYREKFPQDWEAYAARVRQVRRPYYAFWIDNAAALEPTMAHGRGLPPPDSWADARGRAVSERDWAHEQLRRFGTAEASEGQRPAIARNRQQKAEALVAELETVMHKIRDRRSEAAFVPDEWTALYRLLDERAADQALPEFWSTGYRVLRSEIAKQLYADDPDAVISAARHPLETDWAFDAEQATLQIGGAPRGWCADFIENKPNSVMLLQFPSNNLTHFRCGDVSDLVVSISRSDLARHDFRHVRVDVSN